MGYHPGTLKSKPYVYLVSYDVGRKVMKSWRVSLPYALDIGDIIPMYDGYYEVYSIDKSLVSVSRSSRRVVRTNSIQVVKG